MRITDEYKFREDICNLNVILEPYTTKYNNFKDILKLHHIDSEYYSRRLNFLDKHDTIYTEYWKEELVPNDKIILELISESPKDNFEISCNVVIEVFEDTAKIKTIKILEEPT